MLGIFVSVRRTEEAGMVRKAEPIPVQASWKPIPIPAPPASLSK